MSTLIDKITNKDLIIRMAFITAALCLFAFATQVIIMPNNIQEGGLSGISVVLQKLWNINTGITMGVVNIILFIFAFKYFEKLQIVVLIYCILANSWFMGAWADFVHHHPQFIVDFSKILHLAPSNLLVLTVSMVVSGVLCGISFIWLYGNDGLLGGGDIIGRILKHSKFKIPMWLFVVVQDSACLLLGLLYTDAIHILFSLGFVLIYSGMMKFATDRAVRKMQQEENTVEIIENGIIVDEA
jgi:uncharacterized membrane-anchored protein YitT (DUF2179 family)